MGEISYTWLFISVICGVCAILNESTKPQTQTDQYGADITKSDKWFKRRRYFLITLSVVSLVNALNHQTVTELKEICDFWNNF